VGAGLVVAAAVVIGVLYGVVQQLPGLRGPLRTEMTGQFGRKVDAARISLA
jgi:hypothetical protein